MRSRHIPHASVLVRRAVEWNPGGERVELVHRPVGLILMRLGVAPARILVERLVVPETQHRHADQERRGLGDLGMERQRQDLGMVLPQVDALRERLLVRRLFAQRAMVVALRSRTARSTASPNRSSSRSVRSPGTTTKPSRRNLSIKSGLTTGFVLKLKLLRTASQIITMIAQGLSIYRSRPCRISGRTHAAERGRTSRSISSENSCRAV